MKLHILGIGGTFMSALALLARKAGFEVSGCDANCYPPVSDLLQEQDIAWVEGYEENDLALKADHIIVGNVVRRGFPVMEAVLNARKPYTSGPQWLAETLLPNYKVIAVTGTHGKTTTAAMISFILAKAGLEPGFLIGGVAANFNISASLGKGPYFVIEADEYDSAFFDKRPKFMHYRPDIAILNNLEFDHADIYADLGAIEQQFHYLLRTIPSQGLVLKPRDDEALNRVIKRGIYSRLEEFTLNGDARWQAKLLCDDGSSFELWHQGKKASEVHWPLIGSFNVSNALVAIAASYHAGVALDKAAQALAEFKPVKRRLELRFEKNGISLYDDFAHHPTAITKTLAALKASKRHQRILAVLECGSNTMRLGIHGAKLGEGLKAANESFILKPKDIDLDLSLEGIVENYRLFDGVEDIIEALMLEACAGDAILVMSNKGFGNIHQRLIERLS